MNRFRSLISCAGVITSLLAGSGAGATEINNKILLPCSTPGATWSDLINRETLDNGICGWSEPMTGPMKYTLSTTSADLDIWFFDANGDYITRHSGGSTCSSFTFPMPAGTRRFVIVLTPSMCQNQANVSFLMKYPVT